MAKSNKLNAVNGYAARDKDGELYFYTNKPTRYNDIWDGSPLYCHLPIEMLPSIQWENGPVKVDLSINIVK